MFAVHLLSFYFSKLQEDQIKKVTVPKISLLVQICFQRHGLSEVSTNECTVCTDKILFLFTSCFVVFCAD